MRNFMKIVESITLDYAANAEIERKLENHSENDRPMIRDGLETIMNGDGINVSIWVHTMRKMWPDRNNEEMKRIFKIMTSEFSDLIKRTESGDYVWSNRMSDDSDIDMSSQTAQLAKAQIEYTAVIIQMMRNRGQFSKQEIASQFSATSGMQQGMADMLVQHVIDQMSGSLTSTAPGRYTWVEDQPKTGLSFLKDLEGYQRP